MSETTLVRTRAKGVVHRRGCRYAQNALPWDWAEGKTRLEVANGIRFTGVKCCKTCKPMDALQ